jgi:DNA-binding HxlR family transcriptional regulator
MSVNSSPEPMPMLHLGKWTVGIMFSLKERPHRYGELRRRLPKISQRMLTRTLRHLETAGLISRHVTKSKSVAVEYCLTKLGRTSLIRLISSCRWANRHREELSGVIQRSNRGAAD